MGQNRKDRTLSIIGYKTVDGHEFDQLDEQMLRMMGELGTVIWTDDPFTLNSGIKSNVYVVGREELTDNSEYLELCAQVIGRKLERVMGADKRQPILIGVPAGATSLAAGITHYKRLFPGGKRAGFRVMREKQKTHGKGSHIGTWMIGRPEPEKHRYGLVENTVTSGASLLDKGIRRLKSDGYPTEDLMNFVLVDRQQGGINMIRELGYDVSSIYALTDVAWAFMRLGIPGWNQQRVEAVQREIEAHQVA